MPPNLLDIPDDILVDRLLPTLDLEDLVAFSRVNRRCRVLAEDEGLWAFMAQRDFSVDTRALARPSVSAGFYRRVYFGVDRSRVFVWGASSQSRLGGVGGSVMETPGRNIPAVSAPAELTDKFTPFTQRGRIGSLGSLRNLQTWQLANPKGSEGLKDPPAIVELQASGWGFVSRCASGRLYVWGALNGSSFMNQTAAWSSPFHAVRVPTYVPLPCVIRAMSVGRFHVVLLDEDNLIWDMTSWGQAHHHTAAALTGVHDTGTSSTPHHIVQVSAGWSYSACLTRTGKMYFWEPLKPSYRSALPLPHEMISVNSPEETAVQNSNMVRWGTVNDSVVQELPEIPARLPSSEEHDEMWTAWAAELSQRALAELQRVVKIASGADFLIALKGNGEVWFHSIKEASLSDWIYIAVLSSPDITHISAQFTNVTSYTTSLAPDTPNRVYAVTVPDPALPGWETTLTADPLPGLQDKNVIKVAHGDWHHAALTSSGEMYTWGTNDSGQLGIGHVSASGTGIEEPTKVSFGTEPAFAFDIAAAGHHTGALILGDDGAPRLAATSRAEQAILPPSDENPDDSIDEPNQQPEDAEGSWTAAAARGGGLGIRVGFAGRGSRAGRVAQAYRNGLSGNGQPPSSLADLGFRRREQPPTDDGDSAQ